jgi:hypothetical protein
MQPSPPPRSNASTASAGRWCTGVAIASFETRRRRWTRPRTTPTGTRATGTTPSSGTPAPGCLSSARQRSLWAVQASALETWRLRPRWREDSSGRRDAFALSGDLDGRIPSVECWDTDGRRSHYLLGSADAPVEEEGVDRDCVLGRCLENCETTRLSPCSCGVFAAARRARRLRASDDGLRRSRGRAAAPGLVCPHHRWRRTSYMPMSRERSSRGARP